MARRARWIDTLIQETIASGAQGTEELFQNAAAVDTQGWTITRTIGDLWLMTTTIGGAQGAERLDLGLGLISEEAVNAGVFPDPNQESDRPGRGWVYRTRCVTTQSASDAMPLTHCVFDIRAQRKVEHTDYFLIMNTNPILGTAFSTSVQGIIRTLVLLP